MQTNYGAQKVELLIKVFENVFRLLVRYLYLNPDPKVFASYMYVYFQLPNRQWKGRKLNLKLWMQNLQI